MQPAALLITAEAVSRDVALRTKGARKLLVVELYPNLEEPASESKWNSVGPTGKCPVEVTTSIEFAIFNQLAPQSRHFHAVATEIYTVLEGRMLIEVEGEHYVLNPGESIVVNPGSRHEVRVDGSRFLCQVIVANCQGRSDKFLE